MASLKSAVTCARLHVASDERVKERGRKGETNLGFAPPALLLLW